MASWQNEPAMSERDQRIGTAEVETVRRERAVELNSNPGTGPQLAARYGRVWDTEDLARDFEVIGFAAPYVVVRRKTDGQMGSLEFQHHPRFYFNFEQDYAA